MPSGPPVTAPCTLAVAALLAHLAEVEGRGIHRERACRAKHRTKKERSRLLRALDPLPDLPVCIEPLAPAPARPATAKLSWADFVESLSPVARELGGGDSPRDWMNDELPEIAGAEQHAAGAGNDEQPPALARSESSGPALARSEVTGPALARPEAAAVSKRRVAQGHLDGSRRERLGVAFAPGGAHGIRRRIEGERIWRLMQLRPLKRCTETIFHRSRGCQR
jgi:hypothetical protein